MRPFTCICMLMAAGSGLFLYQTKHRSQLLDREIAHTYKQIDQTRERITALRGEWALLGEPEQLGKLAQQHTGLKTLSPTQFVAMADLGARLPAPLPPGAMPPSADDAVVEPATTPAPVIVPPAPVPVPIAARPIAVTPPRSVAERAPEKAQERASEKPVQFAALPQPALPVPAPSRPVPRPAAPAPAAAAAAVTAPSRQPSVPAPVLPPAAIAAPRFAAPVVAVSANPMPPARAQNVDAEPRPARTSPMIVPASLPPQSAPSGYISPAGGGYGSALGAAARVSLPAPVPFGAGQR